MDESVGSEPPPPAPTDHAADRFFDPAAMGAARLQLHREHGGEILSKVMLNLGEYQIRRDGDGYRWEGEAWFGGDINRLVIKSEGEASVRGGVDSGELQALYSRAVTPYFNLQAGVRQDFEPQPRRTYAVLGVEGLAPYWFDVQSALFLSDRGEVLGRLEGTYDVRLTQRLILQPRVETNLAAQSIPEIGVGAGVSDVELGLRLRYEIRREFAPYVGVSFEQKLGAGADFARSHGEDASQTSFVFGLRAWF
jgi:copper resistance protein B